MPPTPVMPAKGHLLTVDGAGAGGGGKLYQMHGSHSDWRNRKSGRAFSTQEKVREFF